MLERHTRESGSLSWATPNTLDGMPPRSKEAMDRQFQTTRTGRRSPSNLREQVHPAMWPTPAVRDYKGANGDAHFERDRPHADQLPNAVKLANWPTPKVPSGGGQVHRNTPGGGIRKLEDAISAEVGYNTGQLNADWVEILMGFSIGFTDLNRDEPIPWPGWPAGLWPTARADESTESLEAIRNREKRDGVHHSKNMTAMVMASECTQYSYEPPRVVTGQKNRTKRLKCLGNAVVPAQAALVFQAIMSLEKL